MILKQFIRVYFLLCCTCPLAFAQQTVETSQEPYAKHSIYFDGLGMTLMPGISYERKLNSTTAVRIGIGHFDPALFDINLFGHHDDEPTPQVDKSITTLPVSVQYLAAQSENRRHSLELGAGITLAFGGASGACTVQPDYGVGGPYGADECRDGISVGDDELIRFDGRSVAGLLSTMIAYRYEPVTKGFFFRFGFVPAFAVSDAGLRVAMLPNLSLGYSFSAE